MPNWVFNNLQIEGPTEDINKLKQQVSAPFAEVHENWNAETNTMEIKEYKYSNPVFAFHNIYNHIQDGVSNEEYLKQPDYTAPLADTFQFKGNHWYSWNNRNWGTKWDVAVSDEEKYPDTQLLEESEDSLAYRFNTAWSTPNEIITKLSEQYPNLVFTLYYEEETGWGGETVFTNGSSTDVEVYGWKCKECDHMEEEQPYCEECEFDTCPSCAYNEADEACEQHRKGHNAHLLA